MKFDEFEERKKSILVPGSWSEIYLEDEPPFMRRRFYCGDCGSWNTYGPTPYCPYCGKQKHDTQEAMGGEL